MNAVKVVKLDVLTVRPYLTLKNLGIFLGLGIIYAVICKTGFMMLFVAETVALLFSGYPFMAGENAGIDPLYRLFGIPSKDVVKGRYAVGMLMSATMLLLGALFYWVASWIYPQEEFAKTLLLVGPSLFFTISLIIFLEYPFYFKLGYLKGRTMASIPYYVVCVAIWLGVGRLQEIVCFLTAHAVWVGAALLTLWLAVLYGSYRLSLRYYSGRDF